jgi:hypothetical protein
LRPNPKPTLGQSVDSAIGNGRRSVGAELAATLVLAGAQHYLSMGAEVRSTG